MEYVDIVLMKKSCGFLCKKKKKKKIQTFIHEKFSINSNNLATVQLGSITISGNAAVG